MNEHPRFECAPGLRLQAHERLSEVHYRNIEHRLERIDQAMEKLEKRLWLAVYGVVALILSQAVLGILAVAPTVSP